MGKINPSRSTDYSPEDVVGIETSRDFKHCHKELVKRFLALASEFEVNNPGKKLLATCTYRSPEAQRELFKIGRFGDTRPIVTTLDGFNKKSRHNEYPSTAMDVAVCVGGKPAWDEKEYYPLGPLSTKHELEWGGYWTQGFQDFCHIQLRRADI